MNIRRWCRPRTNPKANAKEITTALREPSLKRKSAPGSLHGIAGVQNLRFLGKLIGESRAVDILIGGVMILVTVAAGTIADLAVAASGAREAGEQSNHAMATDAFP